MREPPRFTGTRDMFEAAARALGRIDRDGLRGLTGVSVNEIAAMAGTLAALGLVPVPPGAPTPDQLIVPLNPPLKEAHADVPL